MRINMEWLRDIIDNLYIYLSGLSDYELLGMCLLMSLILIVLFGVCFLPKEKKQTTTQAIDKTPNTASRTVALSADNTKASSCSQKNGTMSTPVPRASSAKPELDIEELKRLLN